MKYKFILFSPWLLKSPGNGPLFMDEISAKKLHDETQLDQLGFRLRLLRLGFRV